MPPCLERLDFGGSGIHSSGDAYRSSMRGLGLGQKLSRLGRRHPARIVICEFSAADERVASRALVLPTDHGAHTHVQPTLLSARNCSAPANSWIISANASACSDVDICPPGSIRISITSSPRRSHTFNIWFGSN